MSYQVLARKWRPQDFHSMVGQEHVLKALVHALESQRLHHAYLFTGTRGVGKTTLGRILAKCFNCETGITAKPCGVCSTCTGIVEGRYVDLIEIDAASRTKVEDMRELLDNVQYAPTSGRFKIYLIDEVHMLSTSSFNALLKTLEEPPEHVKFIFATTDPQKLPVTVLSRCLQFNLMNLTAELIQNHLQHVLEQEQISFEIKALWSIARAADGSMRDALSLTDQAIAYSERHVTAAAVEGMLGMVGQDHIQSLISNLVRLDAPATIHAARSLEAFSPSYENILADMIGIFHRVAIEQYLPGTSSNAEGDQAFIAGLVSQTNPEAVQLFYSIAVKCREELSLVPDIRIGFEMMLLRMLAFARDAEGLSVSSADVGQADTVQTAQETSGAHTTALSDSEAKKKLTIKSEVAAAEEPAVMPVPAPQPDISRNSVQAPDRQGIDFKDTDLREAALITSEGVSSKANQAEQKVSALHSTAKRSEDDDLTPPQIGLDEIPQPPLVDLNGIETSIESGFSQAPSGSHTLEIVPDIDAAPDATAEASNEVVPSDQPSSPEHMDSALPDKALTLVELVSAWPTAVPNLGLTGMTQNLLFNMAPELSSDNLLLHVESGHYRLLSEKHRNLISEAIQSHLSSEYGITYSESIPEGFESTAMWREKKTLELAKQAWDNIQNDPHVDSLVSQFGGKLVEDSVKPLKSPY